MSTNAVNAVNTVTDAEHTRLLLIDDDVDFAIANAEFLEQFDYLVEVAHDDQQAKQIIELIGGNFGFDSKQNEGSTFWVDVPLSSQHALI